MDSYELNKLNKWDFLRNYTSGVISFGASISCFLQDSDWVKLGGVYLLGVAITKFIGGSLDIIKLNKSYKILNELKIENIKLKGESQSLRKQLEERVESGE